MPAVNSFSFVSGVALNSVSFSAAAPRGTETRHRSAIRWGFMMGCSGEDVGNHIAINVGEAFVAALMEVGQLLVIQAETVQHGRVDVVDVSLLLDGLEAKLIGRAVTLPALDAAARQPHREAVG